MFEKDDIEKEIKAYNFWKESVRTSIRIIDLCLQPVLKTINELVLIGWKNKLNEIIYKIDEELKRRDKQKE